MAKFDLIQQIASLLAGRGLSLYQISKRTRQVYGRSSPYYVPHNYYSQLRQKTYTPSIYQLIALSRLSGYRLDDWLNLFGINPDKIATLQVRLPSVRTQLLHAASVDKVSVPFVRERSPGVEWDEISPLSRLLAVNGVQELGTEAASPNRFVYAKIGCEDALSFPCLAPGSVVRADPDTEAILSGQEVGSTSKRIFLLEHGNGYVCCRLRRIGVNKFSTVSSKFPYPEIELTLRKQAHILGVVDLEVRSLAKTIPVRFPSNLARNWISEIGGTPSTAARQLKAARRKMNLSLPAASKLTHQAAKYLADHRYSISASSLSDYEVATNAPRHIHKVISLCAIYGIHFPEFLKAIGVDLRMCGTEPMPGDWRDENKGRENDRHEVPERRPGSRLDRLKLELSDLPILLAHSLTDISGLPKLSLEDFFWTGGQSNPLHPLLGGSILAIVNRRKKSPPPASPTPSYTQPLFLLLKRNGGYFAGFTTLDRGLLTVHGVPQHLHRAIQLRNRDEAEVVGQIVALLRRPA